MIIGEYEVNETGQIRHLKCREPASSWSPAHRCWVLPGPNDPYSEGKYMMVTAPTMVQTLSKIRYAIWSAARGQS